VTDGHQLPEDDHPPARVIIWDDQAPERAAVWYVGAFGALGAVLLAGASIAEIDWTRAQHPVEALLLVGVAVVAAFTVVTLASRVIYPGCTSLTLRNRTRKVEERLQDRKKAASASGPFGVSWGEIASEDSKGVLNALLMDAAFQSSPRTLWAGAQQGRASDQAELKAMVEAANSWLARKHFKLLRIVTPIAAIIVLIGGLAWKPLTAPAQTNNATSAQSSPILSEQLLVLKEQRALASEQLSSVEAQNRLLSEQNRLLSEQNRLLSERNQRHWDR
jgi:hypothetical protein